MAEPNDIPTRWRDEEPAHSPEAAARRSQRQWTLALILTAVVAVAAVVVFLSWLRPLPHAEAAMLWLQPAPLASHDREALAHNPLFASAGDVPPVRDQADLSHAMAELASRAHPGVLVVAVSAHADVLDGEVRLLTTDAESTPLREVLRSLASNPARRKLLLLELTPPPVDLRRGLLAGAAAVPADLEAVPDPARLTLVSCSAGQMPLFINSLQRSAFTYYLDRGLRGAADGALDGARDGMVTARELAAYVRGRVERWATRNRAAHQTPELYGPDGDFALISTSANPPALDLDEQPTAYPDWLRDGWKARQQLWESEDYRASPAAFHLTEGLLLEAETAWFMGTDPGHGAENLKADLARLEKRRAPAPIPTAPSLGAQTAQGRKVDAKAIEALRAAIDPERLAAVAPAPAGAPAAPAETLAALKDRSAFDTACAVFDAAVEDADPRPERLRSLDAVLRTQQPEPQFAETMLLRRLAELAARPGEWPAGTVRRALETARAAERVSGDPQAVRIRNLIEAAAQHRYEGETLLLACRGYASTEEADRELQAAAEAYDVCRRSLDAIHRGQKALDRARIFLPSYVPYLEWTGAQDKEWEQAVAAACDLAAKLDAPADAKTASRHDDELARLTDDIEIDLDRLGRPFTAKGLAGLRERLRRPQAQPSVLAEAEAVLTTPFPSADERGSLWEAARTLARRLHEETARMDQAEDQRHAAVPQSLAGPTPDVQEQAIPVLRRGRASLALLRVGGRGAADLSSCVTALAHAEETAGDAEKFGPASEALAAELHRAWTAGDASLHDATSDLDGRERGSWVWLPAGPVADGIDGLPAPGAEVRAQRLEVLAEQRADQARYESRDLAGIGALPDWLARFYRNILHNRPSRTADDGVELVVDPPTVRFATADAIATIALEVRGRADAAAAVRLLAPAGHWFNLSFPSQTPDADGFIPLATGTLVRVPVRIGLRSDHAATALPAGIVAEARAGDRTYHRLIPLSLQAVTDRLEVFVSADPTGATVLDELRLRPLKGRQSYSLFVRNLSTRPRNLIVRLADATGPISGGEAKITPRENETLPVHFALPPTAPKADAPAAAAPPPAAPQAEAALPEMRGPLQVHLLDADAAGAAPEIKTIQVGIASAAEYTQVANARFLSVPSKDGAGNLLTVAVRATPGLTGPPCPVELVLPAPGGEGRRKAKKGTFQGELPEDGGELTLTAEDVAFGPGTEEQGLIYLTVDGRPRAYVFRTTFLRGGDPVTPRPQTGPALRLRAPHAAPAGPRFEVGVEVDDAPPAATLEVGLGQLREGRFEAEEVRRFPSAQNSRIGFHPSGPDGAMTFEAAVSDWVAVFDARRIVGRRELRARLLDRDGAEIRTVFQPVSLDDAPPEGLSFVDPPKRARKDAPLPLTVSAKSASGMARATFFLGKPTADHKAPPEAATYPARPTDADRTSWTAVLPLKADKPGPIDVSVEAVNAAGLSSFATTTIELTDADPGANDPGRIEGVVFEGSVAQPGLDVVLRDDKNAEKGRAKTGADGKFVFEKVPPGPYALTVEKSATKRYGMANVTVAAGKTAGGVEIKLLMR